MDKSEPDNSDTDKNAEAQSSTRTAARSPGAGLVNLRLWGALSRVATLSRRVMAPAQPGQVQIETIGDGLAPRPRRFGFRASFALFVALPALAASIYFAFLAADQYIVETRFAIRAARIDLGRDLTQSGAKAAAASQVAPLPMLAGQDAYVVASYVRSAAIFADLPPTIDPRAIFTRPEADFWARLHTGASQEELLIYWRAMVSTYVDSMSGVTTVTVRAFRSQDALDLARAIVTASETLVNRLSLRARADAMAKAEAEVRAKEEGVRAVLAEMRAFRDSEGFIDPRAQATSISAVLLQAMSERMRLQSEYYAASRALAREAPTLTTLKSRLDALNAEIDGLKAQITDPAAARTANGGRTIAASLVRFEELEIKRQFSEKLYAMSQDALERARQRVERQNLYLSVFVPPTPPQSALFPERFSMSLRIAVSLTLLWGIAALATAAVRDHTI